MGTTVNQMVRDHFLSVVGEEDIESRISRFRALSGNGNSNGWKWNRDEIYEERLDHYGRP